MVKRLAWTALVGCVGACVGDSSGVPDGGGDASQDATIPDAQSDTKPPSDAGDAGSDGGTTFVPTDLGTRLALWLDGSKGTINDGGAVTRWVDQSGNGNDAYPFTNDAGIVPPALHAGAVNGKTAVLFANNSMSIADSVSLDWSAGDYLLSAVVAYTNVITAPMESGQFGQIFEKLATITTPFWGVTLTANAACAWSADGGASAADTVFSSGVAAPCAGNGYAVTSLDGQNTGVYHSIITRRSNSGATLVLRVDGKTTTATVPTHDLSGASVVFIGGATPNPPTQVAEPLQGNIAELVAAKGTVSDAELANLEAYFKAKYALPF